MGFVLTSTHQEEEKVFTLSTIKPTPFAVYDILTMQWKYYDKIIPPNQQLKRLNKVSLHQTLCDFLIDFLHTDLDGNLSFTMNPYCVPKFTEYFLDLFKGMPETQLRKQIFERTMKISTFKTAFIDHMKETAILGTMIPLSIFTNLFHQRFKKHSMLESTLEIMQHYYFQMETEPNGYSLFPGDMAYYTLKCSKCCKSVSPHGSIGEILMHAPIAMLDHWHMISPKNLDMIQPNDDNDDNEIDPVPLLCFSYERFLHSRNLLIDAWNSRSCDEVEGSMLKRCKNIDYGSMHKEISPAGTISSTLALITVLSEDVVEAVNIHNTLINSGDPQNPWPDVILMNRTDTFGRFVFEGGIIKNEEYSPLQKKLLKLLEGLCIFGYQCWKLLQSGRTIPADWLLNTA